MSKTAVLEYKQLFSKSSIWQIQKDYFKNKGIEAWTPGGVPYYVTSNANMGKTYAEMTYAFLEDIANINKTQEKVYLIELGSGLGRFSYYFLYHFSKLYKNSEGLPPFCYIMSDISEKNIDAWKSNPKLQNYVNEGILDFCLYDMEHESEIHLEYANHTIEKNSLKTPLIAVANYVFDTVCQDLFYMRDNRLYNCLLTLKSQEYDPEKDISEQMKKITLEYDYDRLDKMPFQEDRLNKLLQDYVEMDSDVHVLFPTTALQCIERLKELTSEGVILLTADKGKHRHYHCEPPQLVVHGSFSMSVNYHVLCSYAKANHGKALFPNFSYGSINVGCLLLLRDVDQYDKVANKYDECIKYAGPDAVYYLTRNLISRSEVLDFHDIIYILSLTQYDPHIFKKILPHIFEQLSSINQDNYQDIIYAISRVWEMNYPLENNQLAYDIGHLLYAMGSFDEALFYLKNTEKIDRDIIRLIIHCHYELEQYDEISAIMRQYE